MVGPAWVHHSTVHGMHVAERTGVGSGLRKGRGNSQAAVYLGLLLSPLIRVFDPPLAEDSSEDEAEDNDDTLSSY